MIYFAALLAFSVSAALTQLPKKFDYQLVTVPKSYSLSFDLRPTGVQANFSSIMRYSQGNLRNMTCKKLSIWYHWQPQILVIAFVAGTTRLHVRVSTKSDDSEGIWASKVSLPLDCTTSVKIEAFGGTLTLKLNNTVDSTIQVSDDRLFGDAKLYMGDSSPVAIATISEPVMTALLLAPISNISPIIRKQVFVPQNFSLSFDLRPTGIQEQGAWSHILQYSKNGKRFDRIPGNYF